MIEIDLVDPKTDELRMVIAVREDGAQTTRDELAEFANRLFSRGVIVGVFVDPESTYVIRDSMQAMKAESFDAMKLQTADLFSRMLTKHREPARGPALVDQVRTWLAEVDVNWFRALHPDAAPLMVPDVVGLLLGAEWVQHPAEEARAG